MPDLVTHVAVSHLIKRPFELKDRGESKVPFRILFYLGTVLPDILTRPWYILFPVTKDWTFPFHTPVGMIVTSGLIAFFFERSMRKKAFTNLSVGAGLHFLLDALQTYTTYSVFWIFPFSYQTFGFGLAGADEIMNLIPLWIGLIVLLELAIYLYRNKASTKNSNSI